MRHNTASNSSGGKRSSATEKRYDSALGFVNVANASATRISSTRCRRLSMTKVALTKAEKEYKSSSTRVSDLGLCPLVNCSRHSSAKIKCVSGKNKRTAQADEFILPTKNKLLKVKVQNPKDIINVSNGFLTSSRWMRLAMEVRRFPPRT
ncbi:hypothetical protein CEXT_411211 [Caerostris extrusa]|uniref:Uncharacterized protein n=1 Tax=Caerostris extrusa TaxID=172846 RepID=A0AAV4XSU2_CAEEX|nr:hypothetical protein CEXT_411211 [Caerostris extrusa]